MVCPAGIEYVPVMWISHMHNMQLHRLTYRPTEDDLAAHILAKYSNASQRYFAVMQVVFSLLVSFATALFLKNATALFKEFRLGQINNSKLRILST
jgi:hypothetical protein